MADMESPGALAGATGAGCRCATAAGVPNLAHRAGLRHGPDARTLTGALGGRWHGRYGAAPCPVCQPERRRDQAALSIGDGDGGRLLLRCHKAGCAFADILTAAGIGRGEYRGPDPAEVARREAERRAEAMKRAEQARRLWREALPIEGTPAEAYLRGRGIRLDR
jgi:hypothetical protein